jgi:hypothetical protein
MKKMLALVALAALAVYGVPFFTLTESGARHFLDELESLSMEGKSPEYCARLHPDLTVSINDRSADPPAVFDGNEQDFCDYVSTAAKGMKLLGISMDVKRNDFKVTRSWLHPWTAQVSYQEDRTTTMSKLHVALHTQSEDELTLVQTFKGVKLRALKTKAWAVE